MKTYTVGSELLDKGHPVTISVIGAGGTGSQILTHLARIHKSLLAMGELGIHVVMWDADKVDGANLGRQLFSEADLGQFKSHVLIEKINRFFGTYWEAETKALDGHINYNEGSFNHFMTSNIVITCVDNVKSRRWVKYLFDQKLDMKPHYQPRFWIDTGNNQYTGQVIMGCKELKMPDVLEVFPEMEKYEDKKQGPSCSMIEALQKQDLFVNSTIALVASQLVWDIVKHRTIRWAQAFINLNSDKMIIKKHFPNEENQVQVIDKPPRRNNSKGVSKARKKVRKAPAKHNVQRGNKRSGRST